MSSERRTLASLSAAALWQIASYFIPLLTIPYLARTLGAQSFGQVAIGTAVATYAQIVADWGFSYTATQAAARARNDAVRLNQLIWATIAAKSILGGIAAATVVVGARFAVHDPHLRLIIYLSLGAVLGTAFNLDWALRGIEQIRRFAISSVLGRLAAVPLVFILVHGKQDGAMAALATAASAATTAATTVIAANGMRLVRLPSVRPRDVWRQIRDGLPVFGSTAIISLYTTTLSVVLGGVSGAVQVGLFSGADKIRRLIQSAYGPIGMVFYPRLSYLAEADRSEAEKLSLRVLRVQVLIAAGLSFLLFVFAPIIVSMVLGPNYGDAVSVLRVLSVLVFGVGVSNVLGTMIMLPFGLRKDFIRCIALGAIVGLGSAVPLASQYGALGAAWSAAGAETAVTVSMYVALSRRLRWFRPYGVA